MRPQSRTAEEVLASLATNSHGVVTRRQMLEAGITPDEIKHRVRRGALLREHTGIYRVGHRAPSIEARYLAAVLACGEGAVLSGRAAGHLLGLLRGSEPPAEVTAPTERRIAGVTTRRCRRLNVLDRTIWRGVPATTVARTLLDLAGMLDAPALGRACHEAGVRFRTTPSDVERALDRRPNSPGAGALRAILRGDERITLSALERRFLARLREAGLPLPQTNRRVGRDCVDCRWPDHHLTVELDGYRYHSSRHAWEQDRRRERAARARGDELRRYTYGDVVEDPRWMLTELQTLLHRRPA
jgi:very-short-patch-repair endonuclease